MAEAINMFLSTRFTTRLTLCGPLPLEGPVEGAGVLPARHDGLAQSVKQGFAGLRACTWGRFARNRLPTPTSGCSAT